MPGPTIGGGGIYNDFAGGVLTLLDSSVSGNTTSGGGGGIDSAGTLTVRRSTISGNVAEFGGGLLIGGTARLFETTVSANSVVGGGGDGGGIYNNGDLRVTNSTISGNTVAASPADDFAVGGGICNSVSEPGPCRVEQRHDQQQHHQSAVRRGPGERGLDFCLLGQGAGVGDFAEGGGDRRLEHDPRSATPARRGLH